MGRNANDDKITATMERVLDEWIMNPFADFEDIAAAAGVSVMTFYRYRKRPDFMAEYHARCKEKYAELEARAVSELAKSVKRGEWAAIKYVLDGTGYMPAQDININDGVIKVTVEDD